LLVEIQLPTVSCLLSPRQAAARRDIAQRPRCSVTCSIFFAEEYRTKARRTSGSIILKKFLPVNRGAVVVLIGAHLVRLPLPAVEAASPAPETTIWFTAPAMDFTDSSPMGNDRLGAMMFGRVDEERIVLNESSVWPGSRQDADRPDAYKVLPEIRRLLLEGKDAQAEALVNANFTCKGPGSGGGQYGCYQVLGNLHLTFSGNDTNTPVTDYRRELNLNDAMTRMQFNRGGVAFKREMFVSAPDEVMMLRLTADRPGQILFVTKLDRPERFATVADGTGGLLMTGQMDNGVDGKGIRNVTRVRVVNRGGTVAVRGTALEVSRADKVTLLITAAGNGVVARPSTPSVRSARAW
jgi:alpha-L-fucosidase 2